MSAKKKNKLSGVLGKKKRGNHSPRAEQQMDLGIATKCSRYFTFGKNLLRKTDRSEEEGEAGFVVPNSLFFLLVAVSFMVAVCMRV